MGDLVPIITSLAWLFFVGSALASFRLGWSTLAKMALVWIAIFLGLVLLVEVFLLAQGTTSAVL